MVGTRVAVWVLAGVLIAGMGSALVAGEAAIPASAAKAAAPAVGAQPAQPAKPPTAEELDKAVAAMRRIDPSKIPPEEAKARGEQLDKAWNTVVAAGPAGAAKLKDEIAKIDAAKEKDDFFKLGAAAILWSIGGADEAAAVAGIWTSGVDLTANYSYVFYAAFGAARTQDDRVVPMLAALLADRKGVVPVPQHSMSLSWPLTQEFLWGAFGSKAMPALARVLDESKDDAAREAAMMLMARGQYLPALEKMRRLATEAKSDLHMAAVRAVGVYGHPQDYDFLAAGAKSKDPREARWFAYALHEYDDLRAVPILVEMLGSADVRVRQGALGALVHLLTPESFEAVRRHCGTAEDPQERETCATVIAGILRELGLTTETYGAKAAEEKARLLAGLRDKREAKYRATPSDRKLTHDDLLKAAAQWQADGRIAGGAYEWVQDRHVLAAATADDIPLLMDVKAKCCLRLSDECLSETRTLDGIIGRLGRSRYRKVVGVTEKAEGLPAAK